MKFKSTEVFSVYNAILTILKAESDPRENHTAKVTADRWRLTYLDDIEEKVIKGFIGERKKVRSPYVFDYTGDKVYLILADSASKNIPDFYKIQSMFSNIPNKIFLYVNKDAFEFQPSDDISISNIINTYLTIFSTILIDQFTDPSWSDMAMVIFFTLLFIKTNSRIGDKDLEEFLNNKFDKGLIDYDIPFSDLVEDVTELLKNDKVINEAGYIDKDNYYLANKINEICDSYYYEDSFADRKYSNR